MLNMFISVMFNISASSLPLSEFHLVKPTNPSAHPLQCDTVTTAAQSLEMLFLPGEASIWNVMDLMKNTRMKENTSLARKG